MREPKAPSMDDAPGEPERQAGEVQTEIRIQGRWFYRGVTPDVPTLQRLLKDAVRASDRLIARLQKARRQRDAAREEARQNIAEIVLSLTRALKHSQGMNTDAHGATRAIDAAIQEAEQLLRIRDRGYGTHPDRIARIADIARRALHTALVAQSHNRVHMMAGQEAHSLEYALTPQLVDLAHGDVLLQSTVARLRERFQAEGYPTRTIVVRVQDW